MCRTGEMGDKSVKHGEYRSIELNWHRWYDCAGRQRLCRGSAGQGPVRGARKGEATMSQAREVKEDLLLERLRRLPPEKKQTVLDLIEFLESRERARSWLEFDEWALDLAKRKGFAHLTEQDVARIVGDFRSGR